MIGSPYPGYPPTYKVVDHTGGYFRNCMVIELLSSSQLDNIQITYIKEQLEATLAKTLKSTIEKSQVIPQESFDTLLRAGLRLS